MNSFGMNNAYKILIVLLLLAGVIVLLWRMLRINKVCKISIVILLVAAIIVFFACISNHDDREFLPDITVPLEDGSAEIVIKEWRWLLGSGEEIYYKQGSTLILLGKTTGGDDGYCPFSEGNYTLDLEDNTLLVRWHFEGDIWKEARFSLPDPEG